ILYRHQFLKHHHQYAYAISGFQLGWTRCYSWKNFSLEDELTLEIKQSIEKKWSKHVYGEKCPAELSKNNKPIQETTKYILSMFPYPSGKLHLGHVRVYTMSDVLARFYRLQGFKVIHPMGWDAFGLPAENAARDHNIEPEKWTRDNIEFMRKQIIEMGCSFDWEREFATCDPSYYKWTQWLFSKLWEKNLVYKKRAYVYWDPVDKTVLAEEQVDSDMRSWRSGAKVEKKLLSQWFVKTAVYAEQLMSELASGNLKDGWRDVIDLQKHWIGSIKGHFCDCVVNVSDILDNDGSRSSHDPIRIWFSDVSALKSTKYFILRPEHFLAANEKAVLKQLENGVKVMKFGVVNPVTGQLLPVLIGPTESMPLVPDLKLRDWLVSRQRGWGTPIPVVECQECGHSTIVPTELLPVSSSSLLQDRCQQCGSTELQQESDTLDTFFDSSWYFLRYLDPINEYKIFDPHKVSNDLPVDIYIGGKEHATLHLYYARFMNHFLHNLGLSPVREPFQKLIPMGVVMGEAYCTENGGKYLKPEDVINEDGKLTEKITGEPITKIWEKMSKSKHNGIDPELVLKEFGVDISRLLSVSEAAPTSPRHWPPNNVNGFLSWQTRLWNLTRNFVDTKDFGEILFVDDEEWAASESKIFDSRNFYLKGITHNYGETSQISVAVSRLQGLLSDLRAVPIKYLKESIEFERAFGVLLICIYPILPAFSAQLWQSFRGVATHTESEFNLVSSISCMLDVITQQREDNYYGFFKISIQDKEVWEQSWPDVDQNYKLDLICTVNGEELVVKVERQYLDGMDEDTALELAFEDEEISKRISKETTNVMQYKVEPGFRASIVLLDRT
ncbi:Leucine--tRNA ligase, partial [Orchesella cincta]